MPNHLLGHGFALPVGAALLGMGSATQSEVSLRVKETGDFLAEHLTPPTASTLSRSPYRGFVDGSDDGFLRGWVWRVGADDPIEIAVFIDGKFFTRVRAARFREDLRERLVGKGYHGFSVKMPPSVTEAPNATIDVVVAGDGVPLHYPQISIVGDLIRPNRSAMRRMLDGARSIRGKSRIA